MSRRATIVGYPRLTWHGVPAAGRLKAMVTGLRTTPRTLATVAIVATGVVAVLLGGCHRGSQSVATPTATDTASPTATATTEPTQSPSPSVSATDPGSVLAADGIGPYVIGSSMADLKARALLDNIVESPFCTDAFGADATGVYSGKLTLSFRHGLLTSVHTVSNSFVTPSGARVGISLTDLQGIYGTRGILLTGTLGNKAFSVRVPASGLAVLFYLDPTAKKVDAISGGEAAALEDAVHNGEGC
jgi:hypothetical protein